MKQEPEEDDDCYLEEENPMTSPGHAPRVRSHTRSLRAMANPSAVWAHFDLCTNDALRAQCRLCDSIVVRGGANPRQCGTTNLHRHLRVHHGGRLIGRRYHVIPHAMEQLKTDESSPSRPPKKAQTMIRKFRNIAPASSSQEQKSNSLVLKTIPLGVKKVDSPGVGMSSRRATVWIPPPVQTQQSTEVCLRWNSYHSNMQTSFPSLLDSEQFVDVTLACEGRSLKCHKMILSSCSDYLAALLQENPCHHPIILMKDLKFWEVEALVNFMYRGEVNVAHDKLPQLLNAAEALQVKGLVGPSPSTQSQKPPGLIPQPNLVNSRPHLAQKNTGTKEFKQPKTGMNPTIPSSSKRPKNRNSHESVQSRSFTKTSTRYTSSTLSPSPTIKLEPLDIPLSPTDIFSENNEDSSATNYENLIRMHEEDDPGGDDRPESADDDIQFNELAEPPNLHDTDDPMEFVPTDFLEQEQDIVEGPDGENYRNEENEADDDIKCIEIDDDDDDGRIC